MLGDGPLGSEIVGDHTFVHPTTAALDFIPALDELIENNSRLCYGDCKSNQGLKAGRGEHGMQ